MIALFFSVALAAQKYDYYVIDKGNKTYVIVENENEKYITSVDKNNIDVNKIVREICKQHGKCLNESK